MSLGKADQEIDETKNVSSRTTNIVVVIESSRTHSSRLEMSLGKVDRMNLFASRAEVALAMVMSGNFQHTA